MGGGYKERYQSLPSKIESIRHSPRIPGFGGGGGGQKIGAIDKGNDDDDASIFS